MSSTLPREDVFGGDMLSSWAQRSFNDRQASAAAAERSAEVFTPDVTAPVSAPSNNATMRDQVQELEGSQLKQTPTQAQVLGINALSFKEKAPEPKAPEFDQAKADISLKKSDHFKTDVDPQAKPASVKPKFSAEQAFAEASQELVQPAASADEGHAADAGSGAASRAELQRRKVAQDTHRLLMACLGRLGFCSLIDGNTFPRRGCFNSPWLNG
jgi:hypothetical protein